MGSRWGVSRQARQKGLSAAHGVLVGMLIGLAFWISVILLAVILQAVVL